MAFGRFSVYQTAKWVDEMEAKDKWLSIVSADPLVISPLSAEVIGGTLIRVLGSWTRTSTCTLTINEAVIFRGLPPGALVAGVAGFDAAFNGNLLFADMLDEPELFPTGGTYILPAGEYVIGIDVPGA